MSSQAQPATAAREPVTVLMIALEPHAISRQTSAGLTMLFDRAKGVMYELNETASAIVARLSAEPRACEEIVTALAAEFEAPRDEIESDVRAFFADFAEAGLLKISS